MNKKIIALVSTFIIISIVLSATSDPVLDKSLISQTIFVDAVYEPKNKIIKIMYTDSSEKTNLVTLEILGMEKTFHKEFSRSSFIEKITGIVDQPYFGSELIWVVSTNELSKNSL